ncbi:type II secretion system protein [Coraliomargarita algicola]|uniref:Type II secretion system protein n=1 Tax=Coraliomargarita algicola TaxID=3092156 RepID=A0ABZ0RNM4_9BACT|nr:type II secretion system protein [Coraliomargarita sp. J2-16]WPJ96718.1 type II secretion system protein [Coraliomargarita sp. J2-16]
MNLKPPGILDKNPEAVNRHRSQSFHGKSSLGFTLIELLAVIAIIGILSSILMVVLSKARSSAEGVKCVSNLRQLGIITSLYMSDHQQMYPEANNWGYQLLPYLSPGDPGTLESGIEYYSTAIPEDSILFCPSVAPDTLDGNTIKYRYGSGIIAYGINATIVASYTNSRKTPMSLEASNSKLKPSKLMLYGEANLLNLFWGSDERCATGRHGAGMNVIFCDFHVERITDSVSDPRFQNLYFGYDRF